MPWSFSVARLRLSSAITSAGDLVGGRRVTELRPGDGHVHRGRDALARHVGHDQRQAPVVEEEEVIEVARDHFGRRVDGVQGKLASGSGGNMAGRSDAWMSRAAFSSPSTSRRERFFSNAALDVGFQIRDHGVERLSQSGDLIVAARRPPNSRSRSPCPTAPWRRPSRPMGSVTRADMSQTIPRMTARPTTRIPSERNSRA